jgi:hypothetical protein
MDGLELRNPDPKRSKILGALLKARPDLATQSVGKQSRLIDAAAVAKLQPEPRL